MAEIEKTEETKQENKQLAIVANGKGLQLRSMDDMWRFACAVHRSGMAPSSFKGAEQIVIAIQSGAELGLPPMRSLQSFCVVRGNARLWGDAPLALVRQSGLMEYIKEWNECEGKLDTKKELAFLKDLAKTPDEFKAVCDTKRKGDPESKQSEFSVGDARRANLWNKATEKGYPSVWMNYPKRMLQMRARALNLRDNFPDCFSGATIAEEYEGVEMPEAAPTPQVAPRAERKEVENVTVTDTKATIKETLDKVGEIFKNTVELEKGCEYDKALIFENFNQLAAFWFDGEIKVWRSGEKYTLENLAQMQAKILHEGVPKPILDMFPAKAEPKKMTDKEIDERAEELFPEPKDKETKK